MGEQYTPEFKLKFGFKELSLERPDLVLVPCMTNCVEGVVTFRSALGAGHVYVVVRCMYLKDWDLQRLLPLSS